MSTDLLYYHGYRQPQPGDFWTAYRGVSVVGNVACHHPTGPGQRPQFTATFVLGQQHSVTRDLDSLEEAKDALVTAFEVWAAACGLEIQGPAAKPAHIALPEDFILEHARELKTSAEVLAYMRSNEIYRYMREMPKYECSRLRYEVNQHYEALLAKEEPQEQVA